VNLAWLSGFKFMVTSLAIMSTSLVRLIQIT
jgi:hypothetical protein